MDINKMMKEAQMMQAKVLKAQEELENSEFALEYQGIELKVNGKKAIAKVLQKSYNKTVTPQNYNSTQKAFEAYKNGGTNKAIGISKVNITGVEGKKVGTIKLSNPPSPSGI